MATDDAFFLNDEEIIELVDVVEDDDFSGESWALTEDAVAPAGSSAGPAHEKPVVAADEDKDPLTTATLAEIYISQGFYKRALKIYRDLADQNPDNEYYRRKLLELKALIDDDEERARSAAVDIAIDAGAVGDISEPVALSTEAAPVAVLEGWLENIRRLRECRYGNC